MQRLDSRNGKLARTLISLAAFACLCLAGCSMAPAKPAQPVSSCGKPILPPAEHLIVDPEPQAKGEDIAAALALLDPLRFWGRTCSSRMRAVIDWAEAPRE